MKCNGNSTARPAIDPHRYRSLLLNQGELMRRNPGFGPGRSMEKQDKEERHDTIIHDSTVGQRLSSMRKPGTTYIVFQGNHVPIARRLTIGRDHKNSITLEDKLASREHAVIQKIRDKVDRNKTP